jgi:hypothetical protein
MTPPRDRPPIPSPGRHRVVVFGDQRSWESCEGRGPRVVELTDQQFRQVQEGNAESVFRVAPGLPVVDLLRGQRAASVSRPRPTAAPDPAPADVDPLAPLFSLGDFEAPDGRFTPDTIGRAWALARNLQIWAGVDARLDDFAPFRAVPESLWWPHPRCWKPRLDRKGPTLRVGVGHQGGLPRHEEPSAFVAVAWPNGHAVRRLVGDFGPVAEGARRAEATARAMAITAMCRAPCLPAAAPAWCVRRTDRSDPDGVVDTIFYEPAFDRRAGDAVDELTWDDLRHEIATFELDDESYFPSVFLMWRWPANEVVGADLQEVTELLAPAFVAARMAVEETVRPFGRPHPLLGAVRAGVDLLVDIEDFPTGWARETADPVEVIERDLVRDAVGRWLDGFTEYRAGVLLAHAVEWRRLPGIGLAGVIEMFGAMRG